MYGAELKIFSFPSGNQNRFPALDTGRQCVGYQTLACIEGAIGSNSGSWSAMSCSTCALGPRLRGGQP